MAVLKNVVQVNNGQTGWTDNDVLDALEETFADLGFNGGQSKTGVVTSVIAPGDTTPMSLYSYTNFRFNNAAEIVAGVSRKTYRYSVNDTASVSGYTLAHRIYFHSWGTGSDIFGFHTYGNVLNVGDEVDFSKLPFPVASGVTTAYISSDNFGSGYLSFAPTLQDAIDGTNSIVADNNAPYDGNITLYPLDIPIEGLNPTIEATSYDYIYLYADTCENEPLNIIDKLPYSTERLLSSDNYNSIGREFPGQDVSNTFLLFSTNSWKPGTYYYSSSNNSSTYVGQIVLTYNRLSSGQEWASWDYTVPASGVRSSLDLRVYRPTNYASSSYGGRIARIDVLNWQDTYGWTSTDEFIIPGEEIGGDASGAYDVRFGVNSNTTDQINTKTSVCSLAITNFGAGTSSYLKNYNANQMVVKIVNDQSKEYGTTFYSFTIDGSDISIRSGKEWDMQGYSYGSSVQTYLGQFGGIQGLDYINDKKHAEHDSSRDHQFCATTAPTTYPLKIVTYRAQSPQDTNFALIQFRQEIDGNDVPYFTFFLHKGTNFGSGIWDLDYVWQGGYTEIHPNTEQKLTFSTYAPNLIASDENDNPDKVAREALYGYMRDLTVDASNPSKLTTHYQNNLYNDNELDADRSSVAIYYRNSSYDARTVAWSTGYLGNINDHVYTYQVSAGANYYKPIKGIPISNRIAPCPYYLPDDFVMIQFSISPGATSIYPGDIFTVGSVNYEVVRISYEINQTSYDGVTGNSSEGIALCARIN